MKRFVDIASWPAPVVGPAEVAAILGITPSRVNHLAMDDPTFPTPVTIHAGSRRWYRSGIELWASLHRPRRRTAHGQFGPEAAEILHLAEATSGRLRHSGVGDVHFWLALVDADSPGIVRGVLATLGVEPEEVRAAVLRAYPAGDDEGYAPTLRMSPHIQSVVGRAAVHATELGSETIGASAIALSLLDDSPVHSRDRHRGGGDPVTWWLFRRGLDVGELRARIKRATAEPGAIAGFDGRVPPKRRPPAQLRRPAELRGLAPNPLGHDPWERHPWGSIFARRTTGKSWIEDGRQYFFFYDRDRYRIATSSGQPVGYWWQIEPWPRSGRPKGSKGAVVLPLPREDVEWPERLEAFNRDHLLARRPRR